MGTFRFKKFSVTDDGATMKVGTDAVLLGAWCPVGAACRLLDIGTGSGVIALMLAQRSPAEARIDAVELGKDDANQAWANVKQSPWPEKINIIHQAIQHFHADRPYDIVVCNPPYFSKSLLPPDQRRAEVRHDDRLAADDLIGSVNRLLATKGIFSLILPIPESAIFRNKAVAAGLHLTAITLFHTRAGNPPERALMSFSRNIALAPSEETLVLYASENQKSESYQQLTGDFYL